MGRLLMGALLVAVLAGLWLLWRPDGRAVAGSSPTESARAPATAAAPAPDLAPAAPSAEPPPAELERPTREPSAPAAHETRDEPSADDLVVRVVDPAGTPRPGITLRLDRGANEAGSAPGPFVTDTSGHARFDAVRPVLASAVQPWTLRHELPFSEPPRLVLDRATLAAPEVVSVLPGGGELHVDVRDLGGAPAPAGCTVKLRLVRAEDLLNPVLSGPDWKAQVTAGEALFPWVELGQTWELSAWRPEGTIPSRTRARGPRVSGESVHVEIELGADHPLASFRAVDTTGKPLPRAPLELTRKQSFGNSQNVRIETDADGRFTIDGEATAFESGAFVVTYRPAQGPVLQGRASLPAAPRDGWNDGGDVVLDGQPVLCAGRVLDASGKPVGGARVAASPNLDSARWSRFQQAPTVNGATDEQGRFELRGILEGGAFEVRAEQESSRSDKVRVEQGQHDLELRLSGRYALTGQLVVDPGVEPRSIQFQLQAPGAEPVTAYRRQKGWPPESRRPSFLATHGDKERKAPDESQGFFELEPVPGGTYALVLLLDHFEVARVEGLVVGADTDVGKIDLAGRIQACEIALLGATGAAKLSGEIEWRPQQAGAWQKVGIDGDLVKILTPTVPIDVQVRARGYRHALLADVTGRREHMLEPALRVRLVLDTDGELPELPFTFFADLRKDGLDVGAPHGVRYFTKDNREVELDVGVAGTLVVRWHLEERVEGLNSSGSRGAAVLAGREIAIEVLDAPGEQVFTLPLDGAALTELTRHPPW